MSEANIATVKKAYALLDEGNLDAFYDLFADDVIMCEAESLPYGGTYHGKAGLKRGIAKMYEAWSEMLFTIEEVTGGGDLCFVYLHTSASSARTGKTYAFPVAELWRFRDGKVIELRPFYWDTHRAIEVFGG